MKLSELELKIFKHIWTIGEKATIQEILDSWEDEPLPQYTTILKTLQILEQKGLVGHEKSGRAFKYVPLVSKKEAMDSNVGNIVKTFFDGSKLAFAQSFLGDNKFSDREIKELKKLLTEKERESKNGTL